MLNLSTSTYYVNSESFNLESIYNLQIEKMNNLQSIMITAGSFYYLKSLIIQDCKNIKSIMIGMDCCTKNTGMIAFKNLESVTNITIGNNTCINFNSISFHSMGVSFRLKIDMPQLVSIYLGANCCRGTDANKSSLSLKGIYCIHIIIIIDLPKLISFITEDHSFFYTHSLSVLSKLLSCLLLLDLPSSMFLQFPSSFQHLLSHSIQSI